MLFSGCPALRRALRVLAALVALSAGLSAGAETAAAQTTGPPSDSARVDSPAAAVDSLLAALLAAPVEADAALTLDSLHMSPWERLLWGRRGAMRRTGLFPTHPERPGADVRALARLRRRMLFAHQAIGLASVASMAVTVAGGQRAISGGSADVHRGSIPVTIGLYSAGAALAFLSPPRLAATSRRTRRLDSITLHRYLAVAHLSGMIATPLLAPSNGRWSRRHVHQALGYATLATYSAATLVVTLRR